MVRILSPRFPPKRWVIYGELPVCYVRTELVQASTDIYIYIQVTNERLM